MNFFPDSSELKNWSIDNFVLNEEIFQINKKILSAAKNFSYSVEVETSFMTTPETSAAEYYYDVWKNNIEDPVAQDQILRIQKFYKEKGYDINIIQNVSSINTFKWSISW